MKRWFASLQQFGRALMLPIAVLPIAGLLLRLGQPDLLDLPAVAAAGQAIFANLGILFAIGIAVGIARENHGAAGLAAVVCYFVATRGAEVLAGVATGSISRCNRRAARAWSHRRRTFGRFGRCAGSSRSRLMYPCEKSPYTPSSASRACSFADEA